MSHVDEGALHAYLDGALDELPSGRGGAIREHVATCPECAARLEEERRIREQAMAILSSPLPQVELPPLEELRLRAEATSPPKASRGRRLHRMGWAASVILAIGAGWTLRGGQAVPLGTMDLIDGPSRLPQLEAAPTVPDLDAAARDLLTQALDGSDRGADPDESLVAEADSGDPLVMEPGRPVLFQELAAIDVVTLQDRLGSAPALPPLEASGLVDLLRSSAATVSRLEGVLSAPRPVAVRAASADAGEERAARRGRTVVTSAIRSAARAPFSTGDASERRRGRSDSGRRGGDEGQLVVPGFEVIGIEAIEEGPAAGGTRALQWLTPLDTLELLHLPEGVEPAELAALDEAGVAELVVLRDGLWLVMRARRSVQELEVLLERLDANR